MLWQLNFITIWVFEFDYRVWVEERIKYIFAEAKTLESQERYLALEMSTSRMAHVERERENTPAKQYQGKI
jgi:hypothetical protein